MSAVKEKVRELIDAQPEDSSFDEILRELALARMIEKGLEDTRLNRTVTNETMKKRIKSWRK